MDTARPLPPRPRVIVTRRLLPQVEARMAELFDLVPSPDDRPMTRAQLEAAMRDCDVLVPTVTDMIDAAMIAGAGERIAMIASFGAGTDHIDLAAARAHRILVTNTPGVFTDDTADLTLALIILVSRRFSENARTLREGRWEGWAPSSMLGHSLSGKTLGVVGMGRIGQAVAHRARAFGLEIRYHNRHRLPPAVENMVSARYEPELDRLVAEADILTLHCPAGPETEHLIDARRLGLMKPGACIVNTSRGRLIDEEALIAALSHDRIAAALDVFEREPQVDPRLLAMPGLVALPHLGSATYEGRGAAGHKIVTNIRSWVDGHRPPDMVLPDLI
ncbi:D-glycerate dehydrogenase [Novosphingobium resinovorum]|jgi:glyoxylate reductase|uniref:D-glycerate dehydrogenase n=1 Tax=Novosphingobium resinovorum TaxID=158500 RepID=A0A031K4I7_9SPHN|nr:MULTISPECIES: D-glycerate dehydrogenase [Novosphingobium]AOR75838.1 D-glycerate dehydrogenase [Novosphingobium resinovorum]EZP84836.1 Glyoxylate reductase [Novosphingobium resinovorum]MBF7011202.1 D-glycerate dehydrogenase [Novosphingobium sp. HR1a]WJM29189.1 D-glycerate dehydrogenase [Novosphingobium resinovorum]